MSVTYIKINLMSILLVKAKAMNYSDYIFCTKILKQGFQYKPFLADCHCLKAPLLLYIKAFWALIED